MLKFELERAFQFNQTYRNMKTNTKLKLVTLVMSVLLAGCDSSEVSTVKEATVPQDQTHTYETALSNRASCESEKWKTFEDNSNRTAVEYRCVLKNATGLLAAMHARKIKETQSEFQNYYQAMDQRIEETRQRPALLEKEAAETQEKLAQTQAEEAKADQINGKGDPMYALRMAAIRKETGAVAGTQFSAERVQQSLSDAKANLEKDIASLQQEKERFQKGEQDALAGIEKNYGNATEATEVFQWVVKDEKVFPSWSGVEIQKQDGSVINLDKNWDMTMRDLLRNRDEGHVHYALGIPDNVVSGESGMKETTP